MLQGHTCLKGALQHAKTLKKSLVTSVLEVAVIKYPSIFSSISMSSFEAIITTQMCHHSVVADMPFMVSNIIFKTYTTPILANYDGFFPPISS